MWARTTASLFFLERERAHVNLLGRPCSCFEKHICVYMYLPETSSRSAGLQSTIVFPFWKNLWKIGMKIKLCFNWAYVFWHEGCRLEGSLRMEWGQGRNQAGPWGWSRWFLEGLCGALVMEGLPATWRSSCIHGLREEVKASSYKPCHKLPHQVVCRKW